MNNFPIYLLIFLLFACKKEEETNQNNVNQESADVFEFYVDGSFQETENVISAGIYNGNLNVTAMNMNQTADSYDDVNLTMYIPNVMVGTFDLDTGQLAVNSLSLKLPASSPSSSSPILYSQEALLPGSITISSIDYTTNRIVGTFAAYVANDTLSKQITNGTFDIPFSN